MSRPILSLLLFSIFSTTFHRDDDLLERGIYHKFGEGKNPLKVEKDHVEANRAEFLRSRNQPLKRSINGLDKKLAEVSGYKPFIKNKEVNVKGESVLREFLNISDLDVMAIFRRSSSRWNVVEKIEKSIFARRIYSYSVFLANYFSYHTVDAHYGILYQHIFPFFMKFSQYANIKIFI
mgnify:CR=1 FL=1